MKIYKNHTSIRLNAFRVKVKAKYVAVINHENDLLSLLSDPKYKNIRKCILGESSGTLFSENYDGLIIKVNIKGIEIIKETEKQAVVEIGAGEIWDNFVVWAIKGETVDAHRFIDQAIKRGAAAVLGEAKPKKKWTDKITYVQVENSRKALSLLASAWYGNPSRKLKVIGVTGTDGKTTTATLIYHILKSADKKVGLITTLSAKIGNKEYDTGFHVTNPEPLALQKFLAKMVDSNCEYAVLEVTSHGLAQDRVAGVEFDTAVLTNITHEHLDYHKTWDEYFESKAKLFKSGRKVVLNKDDKSYSKILSVAGPAKVVSYAVKGKSADVFAENIQTRASGTEFGVAYKPETFKVSTGLVGDYNVSNILAAVSTAKVYGVSSGAITKALKSFEGIEGRLEEIENDKGIRIIIDFAHTPNSLESVLKLLRGQTKGRLIAVFGCAGERDMEKRKIMPKISTKYANISVFTAEDPRSEEVADILKVMVKSTKSARSKSLAIDERGEAISMAINKLAKKGDVVAILGKGHEKSMAYGKVEYPWSDHEAVEAALKGKVKKIIRK